jgi:carbonic anhydrase
MASIFACADSRTPAGPFFNSGFGDIFIIGAAGTVSGTDQVETSEDAWSEAKYLFQ